MVLVFIFVVFSFQRFAIFVKILTIECMMLILGVEGCFCC